MISKRWYVLVPVLIFFFIPVYSFGAVITVTNTGDSGAGSLRQAVADAAPGDEIIFDTSLSGQTISLEDEIVIDKNLTITGLGQSLLTVSGGDTAFWVFDVDDGSPGNQASVVIQGLTVSGAFLEGIINIENLTLTDCLVTDNGLRFLRARFTKR